MTVEDLTSAQKGNIEVYIKIEQSKLKAILWVQSQYHISKEEASEIVTSIMKECNIKDKISKMEKLTVTMKLKVDREDVSTMLNLTGNRLSEEQWDKMKGNKCTMSEKDFNEKELIQMKIVFGGLAFTKLFKDGLV